MEEEQKIKIAQKLEGLSALEASMSSSAARMISQVVRVKSELIEVLLFIIYYLLILKEETEIIYQIFFLGRLLAVFVRYLRQTYEPRRARMDILQLLL